MLGKILALVAAILLIWWLLSSIRRQPGLFSKTALSHSARTMGLLALALIAFIAFCVWLLRLSGS